MSEIDASIALQGKPLQLDNPMNALVQMYQARALGNQNALFPLQQQQLQTQVDVANRNNALVSNVLARRLALQNGQQGNALTATPANSMLPVDASQTPSVQPGLPGQAGNPYGIPTGDGTDLSLQDLQDLALAGVPGVKEMLDAKKAAMQGVAFEPGKTYNVGGHIFTMPQLDPGMRMGSTGVVEQIPGYSVAHSGIKRDETTATMQATNDNTLAPLDRIDPTTHRPYAATVGQLVSAVGGGQPVSAPAPTGNGPLKYADADRAYGFPLGTMDSIARVESNNNPNAVSKKGAQGIFQVMPATQQNPGFGLKHVDPNDPMSAGAYLAAMVKKAGSLQGGLALYNAGPYGNVNNSQTKAYVPQVTAGIQQAGGAMPASSQQGTPANPQHVTALTQLQQQVDAVKANPDPNVKAQFMQQMLGKIYTLPQDQRAEALHTLLTSMSAPAGTPIHPLVQQPVQVAANQGFSGTGPVGFHGFAGPADIDAAKAAATKQVDAQYNSQQKFRDAEFANMADYSKSLNSQLSESQALLQRIAQSRAALQKFQAGGGADMRAEAAKWAQAAHMPDFLVNKIAGGDLASMQEFQKYAAQEALQTMQQSLANDTGKGSTGNRISMQLFIKNNPNLDTDPHAIEKIFNFQTQLHNQLLDESNAFQKFKAAPGADVTQFPNYWANQMIKKGYVQPQMVTGQAMGTQPAGKPAAPSGPARINNDADYAKLPRGALFIAPDGSTRRKR